MKDKQRQTVNIGVLVTPEVKQKARVKAAQQGQTLSAAIADLIKRYLQ